MKLTIKQRLLASSLFVGSALIGAPALAQEADTSASQEAGQVIVVTGSRIASPTLVSASPLQIMSAQEIDDSGVANVQEILLKNPVFGTPTLSRTNSNFLTSSVGVATVDLRNLGTDRTLVLVNGRRFVAGVPSSATVDLNTIPTQFIERIDILTGGASSIYGSDAVAGVVNIIYKDNFEGLEATGQIGISERGDDVRRQANVMMGTNFSDGRGNVTVYLGYSKDGAVFTKDRKRSNVDQISCVFVSAAAGGCAGDDSRIFEAYRPFLSSFAPQGTFFIAPGLTRTLDPNGNLVPLNTNGVANGLPGQTLATGFNRSAFRTIAVPTERYLLALRGHYDVADNVTAFVEGTFAQTATRSELEPFPLDSAGSNGIFPATGGRFNIETDVGGGVIVRNPFVQDFIYNNAIDTNGDGLKDIAFNRRLSDFGNRGNRADRTTFRVLGGLEGSLFEHWHWDAYYAYGQTTESQTGNGQVNVVNFANALAVITDSFGRPICASAQARAQGCAPANIFGGANSLSPEAVRYIEAPQSRNTFTSQQLAGANISGDLLNLWDGPLAVAIGTEYRKEYSREDNDALTQAGLNGGNAIPSSKGQFDVIEGYAEAIVPLLKDRPFFKELQLRGAVRVADYSTVGTTYSWNYGAEYAPISDVRFRVSKARATRAPNIGELFTPPSQTFPTGLVDPCIGVTATSGGTVGTQCRADPGVAANIAANGAFTLNQSDIQGVSGFNRGNPLLGEEKADTFTAGVVIAPASVDWLRNFSLTVDYYNIEIKDAIVSTPRQFILNQCYVEGVQSFCDFVTRRPGPEGNNSPGSLSFIDSASTNSGGLKTEGIDFTLNYRQNLENWGLGGNLKAQVAWTHVFKNFLIPLPGAPKDSSNREVGSSRNRFTATVGYDNRLWGMTLRGTYIGPAFLDDQFTGVRPGEEGSELYRIGAEFVTDMQLRFTPGEKYEFYLGVDNLFDNEPPPIISGLPGNDTGTETDAGTYDPIGRRFYAGVRLKF